MKRPMKSSKFRYLIARNKITRLVDVIDTHSGKVVSAGHANHDAAEKVAAKLLSKPISLDDAMKVSLVGLR